MWRGRRFRTSTFAVDMNKPRDYTSVSCNMKYSPRRHHSLDVQLVPESRRPVRVDTPAPIAPAALVLRLRIDRADSTHLQRRPCSLPVQGEESRQQVNSLGLSVAQGILRRDCGCAVLTQAAHGIGAGLAKAHHVIVIPALVMTDVAVVQDSSGGLVVHVHQATEETENNHQSPTVNTQHNRHGTLH
jgi:hypothetical protein